MKIEIEFGTIYNKDNAVSIYGKDYKDLKYIEKQIIFSDIIPPKDSTICFKRIINRKEDKIFLDLKILKPNYYYVVENKKIERVLIAI